MNGRDWLRAVTTRQQRKATGGEVSGMPISLEGGCTGFLMPVNAAATSGAEPAPSLVFRYDAVLSEADAAELAERLRRAVGMPGTVRPYLPVTQVPGAMPGGDAMWAAPGRQCGCETWYSACRCANRNDQKETTA